MITITISIPDNKANELGELVKSLEQLAASFSTGRKSPNPAPRKRLTKADIRANLEKKFYEKEGRK